MDENGEKSNSNYPPSASSVLEAIDAEATLLIRRHERKMEELRIAKDNKKEATK